MLPKSGACRALHTYKRIIALIVRCVAHVCVRVHLKRFIKEGGIMKELKLFKQSLLALPVRKFPLKAHIIVAHLKHAYVTICVNFVYWCPCVGVVCVRGSLNVCCATTLTWRVYVCLRRLKITNRGLGCDSEQQFEGSHHDFHNVWTRCMIRDSTHPSYGSNLLAATCTYNSQHVPVQTFLDKGRGAPGLEQSDQAQIQEGPGAVKYFALFQLREVSCNPLLAKILSQTRYMCAEGNH